MAEPTQGGIKEILLISVWSMYGTEKKAIAKYEE
jgi:hypothetical protein